MMNEPMPPGHRDRGPFYHGTKADLRAGDLLEPGRSSNYGERRKANYVYLTATLDAATWGAELAAGEGPGRIYRVEPMGVIEDDPNLTDKRYPGNPTRSYRTRQPLRVIGEVLDWEGHPPEVLQGMRNHLEELKQLGIEAITRAVAQSAGVRPALIHYHFGGSAGLLTAVVEAVSRMLFEPIVNGLLAADDEAAMAIALRRLVPATAGDERANALAAHLVVAAVRDPALGAVVVTHLAHARTRLRAWFADRHGDWPAARLDGTAVLVVAALDGLVLHTTLDPSIPVADALDCLGDLLGGRQR